MAGPLFATLQFIHITSAALLLGYLAFAPLWRNAAVRSDDPAIGRHTVGMMKRALLWIALPAFGLVFLSGFAMSFRETSDRLYSLDRRWIQGAIVLTMVLGVLLYGLLGPLRKMEPLLEAGEPKGPATDKLWGEWRTSVLMAGVLALAATALMIYNSIDLR